MKIFKMRKSPKWNNMKTKKLIVTLIFLIGFGSISVNAQSEKSNYLGINLIPLFGNTLELGYELNIKPNLSVDLYSGYVFNSKLSSPLKQGTQYDLENKSGFFIKIGTRYNLRNDLNKFAPFFGLNMVNAIAIEEGFYDDDFDNYTPNQPVGRNSYNLGLNGIIGITSPATKRINIDLGLQVGKVIVNNLLDFHSYMPGMGVSFGGGLRIQGVLRIKYRLK
jgi:hypothetical protein